MDCIIAHLLFSYLNPFLERTFVYDSASCRIGKGTSFGINRLEHHIRSESQNYTIPCKALKIDIKGCFMSINHNILYSILCKQIEKGRHKEVQGKKWDQIIDFGLCDFLIRVTLFNDPTSNCIYLGKPEDWEGIPASKILREAAEGCGLAIGNLLSQLWANVILNELDQYVKRVLKVRHWIRYVDDMYAISTDEEFLKSALFAIDGFVRNELQMTLSWRKISIVDVTKDLNFLGADCRPFRTYLQNVTVSKIRDSFYRISRTLQACPSEYNLEHGINSINSYLGLCRRYKVNKILTGIIEDSGLKNWYVFVKIPISNNPNEKRTAIVARRYSS